MKLTVADILNVTVFDPSDVPDAVMEDAVLDSRSHVVPVLTVKFKNGQVFELIAREVDPSTFPVLASE